MAKWTLVDQLGPQRILVGQLALEKYKIPIRECVLYEYQLGIRQPKKGQGTVSYVTAKQWFKRFRDGDLSLQDDLRSGRPMEIDLAELAEIKAYPTSGSNQITRNIASKLGRSQKGYTLHIY